MDKTSMIFGNEIDKKTCQQAQKSKDKYLKKFGDDTKQTYYLKSAKINTLDFIDCQNLVFGSGEEEIKFEDNALIVGNIRMGFGHYRISIAMASAARALGYKPYWLDLASFDATGSKMIRHQNDLYSKASKISQKSVLFNKLFWEPLNSEGFKKLTYNAKDQKNSELLVPIYHSLPKDIPFIATHAWPSQGAVHAGLTHVVNAIPDNWPMALHLSEGAIHAVQTPFAYLGYKILNGFDKKRELKGISEKEIKMVGRYIDHELLVNLAENNKRRINRRMNNKPLRILLTVGGAGAGYDMFLSIVKHLAPYVKEGKMLVIINFGDHLNVYNKMIKDKYLKEHLEMQTYFNKYDELQEFNKELNQNDDLSGFYGICNSNIFEAVYSTNLVMPECDLLITKPSELAYYPIPKVFMRHIGGHEVYGAINSSELGDGLFETPDKKQINKAIDRLYNDQELYCHLVEQINKLQKEGAYDGAYECVKLAVRGLSK